MHEKLSRRERQIMDIVYERERASAQEVLDALPDPPSYSTVRALLKILEDKGQLAHEQEGARYVYLPTKPREAAAKSALRQVVRTFFGGSVSDVVATLLSDKEMDLSDKDREELRKLIEEAK
ncbi:MAG TPA: BlaI/MecI/CopY family transcriptional regulator [Fimbriimonas sp.]